MVAHQILRRAIEGCNEGIKHGLKATTAVSQQQQQDDGNNEDKPVNPVALLVIALTMMAFFVSLFCISYTYGHLIPTLCMVESPETTAYVPVDSMDRSDPPPYDESTPKPIDEEDILLVQNKPVTSSLRATILHLRARAGYWSRFRGLSSSSYGNVLTGIIISAPLFRLPQPPHARRRIHRCRNHSRPLPHDLDPHRDQRAQPKEMVQTRPTLQDIHQDRTSRRALGIICTGRCDLTNAGLRQLRQLEAYEEP